MNVVIAAAIALITCYGIVQAVLVAWRNRQPRQSSTPASANTLPEMDFGPMPHSLAADSCLAETCEATPSATGHIVDAVGHITDALAHFSHH